MPRNVFVGTACLALVRSLRTGFYNEFLTLFGVVSSNVDEFLECRLEAGALLYIPLTVWEWPNQHAKTGF